MDWDSTTKDQKRKDAFHIFYESVLKPDHELRQDAHVHLDAAHGLVSVHFRKRCEMHLYAFDLSLCCPSPLKYSSRLFS